MDIDLDPMCAEGQRPAHRTQRILGLMPAGAAMSDAK